MKKYLFAACILALGLAPACAEAKNGTSATQSQSIKWYTNYNDAATTAKKENKPMLLFFTGSDWCGWCKKLHQEVFASPEFAQMVGNEFVFVDVDFPMNKKLPEDIAKINNGLKQKYGITGYPTVVILSSSGSFVAETGYRPGGGKAYAQYLQQLMK